MSARDASLERFGFAPFFAAQLEGLDGDLIPARIAIAHGESYVAWTPTGTRKAILAGGGESSWQTALERPQVGDWVAGTDGPDALVIEHLLARRTCLVRRAAGERAQAQVIAANVDVVGIVSAFRAGTPEERDRQVIDEGQLGRYLAVVRQSRAEPLLIVNKSDLGARTADVDAALVRLFPGVPVVLTSSEREHGVERLTARLLPGQTLALVGMSGVGKSTLVNALLGRAAQRVGDVRPRDARGRHTTTHRELFLTESGALLIDTPGMREMEAWGEQEVTAFDDIASFAAACRFSDCRHASEPACAILAALESGALSAERWSAYRQAGAHAGGRHHRHRR